VSWAPAPLSIQACLCERIIAFSSAQHVRAHLQINKSLIKHRAQQSSTPRVPFIQFYLQYVSRSPLADYEFRVPFSPGRRLQLHLRLGDAKHRDAVQARAGRASYPLPTMFPALCRARCITPSLPFAHLFPLTHAFKCQQRSLIDLQSQISHHA
jgi:hypothetical protein